VDREEVEELYRAYVSIRQHTSAYVSIRQPVVDKEEVEELKAEI
jgi:hypothetical protein